MEPDSWNKLGRTVGDHFLQNEEEDESPVVRPSSSKPLLSFMQQCKSKIYNMYKSYPKTAATFSRSPLFFLGVEHTLDGGGGGWGVKRLSMSCPDIAGGCFDSSSNESTLYSDSVSESVSEPEGTGLDDTESASGAGSDTPGLADKRHPGSEGHSMQQSYPLAGHGASARLTVESAEVQRFMMDFYSRIWLTYRNNFAPFPGTSITTDMGWGCMVRTAQMMLAHALSIHLLGRGWTLQNSNDATTGMHLQILRWFLDKPGLQYPYSIHCIMSLAKRFGKKAGEWFEPSTIMQVLKLLVRRHSPGSPSLTMYVAREQTIFKDSVYALCSTDPHELSSPRLVMERHSGRRTKHAASTSPDASFASSASATSSATSSSFASSASVPSSPRTTDDGVGSTGPLECASDEEGGGSASQRKKASLERESSFHRRSSSMSDAERLKRTGGVQLTLDVNDELVFRPVIIVVPLRLGLSTVNEIYYAQLMEYLEFPQSLGFIGGKPNSSLYFVGYQDDDLIYLDPHVVQPTVTPRHDVQDSTYHCHQPLKMHITELDPTLAIGFYCRTPTDFEDLCVRLQTLSGAQGLPAIGVGHRDPYKEDRDNEVDPFLDDAVLM